MLLLEEMQTLKLPVLLLTFSTTGVSLNIKITWVIPDFGEEATQVVRQLAKVVRVICSPANWSAVTAGLGIYHTIISKVCQMLSWRTKN